MVVRGHVKDGVVVLDEEVELEEGIQVTVQVQYSILPEVEKLRGLLPADLDVKEEYVRQKSSKSR